MTMSSQTIALVAIVLASIFWASAGTVTKILLRTFDPFPLAFLRFLIASIAILPLFLKSKRLNLRQLIIDIAPIALFSAGNIFFFYLGLLRTTANAAAIIYTAEPIMIAWLSPILIGEQVSRKKIQGILLGCVGVLVILLLPALETGTTFTGDILGNILIIIAALSWAFYTIGSRRLIDQKHYSVISVTSITLFTSATIFFGLSLFFPHRDYLSPLIQATNLSLVIYLAILVTVVTLLSFQWAIKHSSATTASLTNYLQPVIGIGLNMLFLGEKLTFGFIIGSILVIAGVFLATGTRLIEYFRVLRTNLKRHPFN